MRPGEGIVWYLRTSEADLGPVHLVVVEGRVSSATAAELGRILTGPEPDGLRSVVVDLSGVDYINGAGLRVFEAAAARFNGSTGELVVCGLRPAVQAAFRLAGSIPHLTTVESREDALRRFTEPAPEARRGSSHSD